MRQLGKGFLWTNISAAGGEEPHRALGRCALASSTSCLLVCLTPIFPLGFSWGCCCQKQLLGLAREVKARSALLASHYREWGCPQGGETKGQRALLCPSPSLGRHKIRMAGKAKNKDSWEGLLSYGAAGLC